MVERYDKTSRLSRTHIFLSWMVICGLVTFTVGVRSLGAERKHQRGDVPVCRDCHIVFVAFDTLRADYDTLVDQKGSLMPTVDTLAERGITFTQAITASSWTLPATMSWFTGVYPSRHKMTNKYPPDSALELEDKIWNVKIRSPQLVMLAEVLRRHGYRTGGFTGGSGVSHQFGFDLGFETYFDDVHFGGFRDTVPRALEWVREHKDERLFVFLHGYDCHGQYEPEGGFDYRYVAPTYHGSYTGTAEEQKLLRQEGLEKGQLFLKDEDIAFWRGVYAEKVERADQEFSHFLHAYENFGLMEKTIFVITSDHGEELMEHGRLDHGPTLQEEVVRVPLIIIVPGLTGPMRIDRQVRSIDIFPTLISLVGITAPEDVSAQLQGNALFDTDLASTDALIETEYRYYTFQKALRIAERDPWKLIVSLESGTRELFSLSQDPHEQHNLYSSQADVARTLEERLMSWFEPLSQVSQLIAQHKRNMFIEEGEF